MANLVIKEEISSKCFDGFQKVFSHDSAELNCNMKFGVYLPEKAETTKCPVLYWLSGLGSTEENFITRSGFQRLAAKYNIIVVNPDTCPRISFFDNKPPFGWDVGFYVDATEEPWKTHYRMYSYISKELPLVINTNFNVNGKQSISGFSMGGHGALVCSLKNPGLYHCVSVLAPLSHPSLRSWSKKVLKTYLGNNPNVWKEWDATELVKKYSGPRLKILIELGSRDELKNGINVDHFVEASSNTKDVEVDFKFREGYDHSYYYVSTFLHDHFQFHAGLLKAKL